ncbi:MAG: RNA methyltransferase, partial [Halobacteriaceae archaeon]
RHIRYPFTTIHELYSSLSNIEAETALVFGREPNGLENSEISQLDQICTIPANSDYPSLNLGQAATIVLYELQGLTTAKTHVDEVDRIRANEDEIESFYDRFDDFLSELDYRDEKHAKIMRLIRRLIGRAHPTGMEIHTLHGVLRKAIQEIEGE